MRAPADGAAEGSRSLPRRPVGGQADRYPSTLSIAATVIG